MTWIEKDKRLSNLKVGDKINVVFKGVPDNRKITSVKTGCGCYSAKLNSIENTITLSFKVPSKSRHVVANSFTFIKTVTVTYDNGSSDKLTCSGVVNT
jgi:hypothetical protein